MSSRLVRWSMGCMVVLMSVVHVASAATLTVATNGTADYTTFDAALAAAGEDDTIQILDSATYDETGQNPQLVDNGLTIMSVAGERATLSFPDGGGYGLRMNADSLTFSNLTVSTSARTPLFQAAGGTSVSFKNVDIKNTTSSGVGVETVDGMSFEFCTFYGAGAATTGGCGISWSAGNAIAVNHCSFDNHRTGILNSSGDASTTLSISNCAFGSWYDYKWMGGFTIESLVATATEDYNASYGPRVFIRAGDVSKTTSGGHSFKPGTYAEVFTGDTSSGDWTVGGGLIGKAADGTEIGAWQRSELTVGAGGNYATFDAALAAATAANDVIRFVDSATYDETGKSLDLSINGLTIMSIEGQCATLSFPDAGDYAIKMSANNLTISNLTVTTDNRDILFQAIVGSGNLFSNVRFINTDATASSGKGGTGVQTLNGMTFEYCTFYGAGDSGSGGFGIMWWGSHTPITVNHCSFDEFRIPILNNAGNGGSMTVSNSAFGAWYNTSWAGGITLDDTTSVIEDYNASYGPRPFIKSADLGKVTSGGHTINAGTYAEVFTGTTSAGDWAPDSGLGGAASDGTTIGAVEFVPQGTIIIIN